jgi:hypothetical protein
VNPKQIIETERRLAALTFEQSPCRAFRVEPQGTAVERWTPLRPGAEGQKFLHHWLTAIQRRALREVGTTQLEVGVWQLALDFGEKVWSLYTLRAMGFSSWTRMHFELDGPLKLWPEGVVLSPDEERNALTLSTDLIGIVLPVNGWTVAGFVFNEHSEDELLELATQLADGTYNPEDYLTKPSSRLGLPRPVVQVEFPHGVPPDKIQFIPPQPRVELHPHDPGAPRLFKEHWVLRLLNPPEKGVTP